MQKIFLIFFKIYFTQFYKNPTSWWSENFQDIRNSLESEVKVTEPKLDKDELTESKSVQDKLNQRNILNSFCQVFNQRKSNRAQVSHRPLEGCKEINQTIEKEAKQTENKEITKESTCQKKQESDQNI